MRGSHSPCRKGGQGHLAAGGLGEDQATGCIPGRATAASHTAVEGITEPGNQAIRTLIPANPGKAHTTGTQAAAQEAPAIPQPILSIEATAREIIAETLVIREGRSITNKHQIKITSDKNAN